VSCRVCSPEIEAFVAGGAPVWGEAEGAEDVLFHDAARALAVEFVAAAIHADAGSSLTATHNRSS
jgi:hypothetical protein